MIKKLLVFMLIIFGLFFVFHEKILNAYGNLFVSSNAKKGADALIILSGAPVYRVPPAMKMMLEGYAKKLYHTTPIVHEAQHKYPDLFLSQKELAIQIAKRENITIAFIPSLKKSGATSTFDEAYDVAVFAKKHHLKRIILTTSKYHSTRSLYAFKKIFKHLNVLTVVEMKVSDKALEKHKKWWLSDGKIILMVAESMKMMVYFFRVSNLPFFEEQ